MDENMLCELCPRRCRADRASGSGFCASPYRPIVAKVMRHYWEEPPVSGERGTGAVFFSGCNMRCCYCQNRAISRPQGGAAQGGAHMPEDLAECLLSLEEGGAETISLVSPMHYSLPIARALETAKAKGLSIPVVYNTNAYESARALRALEGLVDVYLPDFKYASNEYAASFSSAPGYFEAASEAILEMQRQAGPLALDGRGIARKGLIIRHLVLPGLRKDSFRVLDWIKENIERPTVSLLFQYTPEFLDEGFASLSRKVTTFEYESVVGHFFSIGLQTGYRQGRGSASMDFTPDFRQGQG
jgi:putative pyruvate formate lyase activating enzyme